MYKGLSFVEWILSLAFLAIVAGVAYVAIDPQENVVEIRNSQRRSDVEKILNAAVQYIAQPGHSITELGEIPACKDKLAVIGTTGVDLSSVLVDQYIATLPLDPKTGTQSDSGYDICISADNRLEVVASDAENGKVIVVKR